MSVPIVECCCTKVWSFHYLRHFVEKMLCVGVARSNLISIRHEPIVIQTKNIRDCTAMSFVADRIIHVVSVSTQTV